jgi:DMSO reductase anchor subunit
MARGAAPLAVTAIPPQPQRLWGRPVVANFALGGLGAGLYVAAAVAAVFGGPGYLWTAAWVGPALVLAGFLAVATEAGRPLRGPRGLLRVRSSWMSRELWLGALLTLLAATEFVAPGPAPRAVAALVAVALAFAQGAVLRSARAVTAWAVPLMPLLFVSSALASGAALLVGLAAVEGRAPARLAGGTLALLTCHLMVWWVFITWSREDAFVRAMRPLREGGPALLIVGLGYLGPTLALALAVALPVLAVPLALLGAAGVVTGHVYMKAALVLRAGLLRPVTLAVRRTPGRTP